ncbi:MAG: hypothetical protein ABI460_06200 [Caldimonas sp.]
MALLGNAAMLLWYDIVPEDIAAHDAWHTREHFPERVGIPGFLRAQRWVAASATGPRYLVIYEVIDIDVLSGGPYLERLNHPTPWTQRTMPSFRGMTRGFCTVRQRLGTVLGSSALSIRFTCGAADKARLEAWLDQALSALMQRDGVTSAFWLESGAAPEMTREQSIRGRDAGVDQVLLVTGYSGEAIEALALDLSAQAMVEKGAAADAAAGIYHLACLSQRA